MTDSLHTFGANAEPFINEVRRIISSLKELEQASAQAGRGGVTLEAGRLLQQLGARSGGRDNLLARVKNLELLRNQLAAATRAEQNLVRAQEIRARFESQPRESRFTGVSVGDEQARAAAQARVADLTRQVAIEATSIAQSLAAADQNAAQLGQQFTGIQAPLTAQAAEIQRINALLGPGAVEQSLQRRAAALRQVTTELIRQRQAADEAVLDELGAAGDTFRRQRAQAAREEERAVRQVEDARNAVNAAVQRGTSLQGRQAEEFLQQARQIRDQGGPPLQALPDAVRDPAAARQIEDALRKEAAAELALTQARQRRVNVERELAERRASTAGADVVAEIDRRVEEANQGLVDLGSGAAVPELVAQFQNLRRELGTVNKRIEENQAAGRDVTADLRERVRLEQELAAVKTRIEQPDVRPLRRDQLAAATQQRQFTRFQQLAAEAAEGFGRRFRATLQFAVSGAAIFAGQRLVREFADAAIQVQRSFADIESALEFDIDAPRGSVEFNQAVERNRRSILLLANQFNVLPTEANEAAEQIIARFSDTEAAMEALRAQLLATKVATIDQSEALRSLSAIGEAFATTVLAQNESLDAQQRLIERQVIAAGLYTQALDNAVAIQLRWGLAVEDTIEGTARLGSTLSQLGFSLEETQALVAGVALQLGVTGSQSAERLNRAFGQITAPQTRTALLDIARASDDFNLSLQDFLGPEGGANVFNRIFEQIQRLERVDPATATRIFEAIGGRRELEVVSAAFRSADIQGDIRSSFDDAAGAAERRFSFLARTIDEILKSIITRFQELAQNFERLGLLGPIQLALQALDQMLTVVNQVLRIFIDIKQTIDSIVPLGGLGGLGTVLINTLALLAAFRGILGTVAAIRAAGFGTAIGETVATLAAASGVRGAIGRGLTNLGLGGIGSRGPAPLPDLTPQPRAGGLTFLTGGRTGFAAFRTGLARAAGVAGLTATAFFVFKNALDSTNAQVTAFEEALRDATDLERRRAAAGRQAGETEAEFAIRRARERRDFAQDLPDLGQASFLSRAIQGFGTFFTLPGQPQARPFGSGAFEQAQLESDRLNRIAVANQDFINVVADQLREGLESFDPESAGITPEIGKKIADAIAELETIDARRISNEEFIRQGRAGELDFGENEALADDVASLLAVFEGILESVAAELSEFAVTIESLQQEAARIQSRVATGRTGVGLGLNQRQRILDDARTAAEQVRGTPEFETAAAAVDQFESDLVNTIQAVYDRDREILDIIFNERDRTVREIEINEAEIRQLGSRGLSSAPRVRQLLLANQVLNQQLIDNALAFQAQLAQAALGNARNAVEFLELSIALARSLQAQIDELRASGRDEEADLLELTRQSILRQASERRIQEGIERLVQQRIAQGRVNDQLAQIEAELIRVQEQLKRQNIDESARQALLNEQRRLRAQAQAVLLERYKAAILLQAGANDTIRELQATITAQTRELEFLAATQGEDSAAYLQLRLAREQSQSALADALIELEALNLRLGTDLTNDFVQAQIDLAAAVARASRGDLGELEQAQADLEVAQAEIRRTQAFFDDRLFFLRFQFETGAIGTGAYLDALRRLQANVDTTTRQGQEIFLNIESIINGLTDDVGSLQFNVPSAIRLPTLFEIRRSLAADALGVDYQDNRTIYVNVDASNIENFRAVLREIEDAFGTRIDQQSLALAPGQASFTLGGI